jgi:SAM-dependent methyltransferase
VQYMSSSIPVATDFIADEFFEFLQIIRHPPQFHRKLWEWAFILHHAEREGKVGTGMKALGFGVGLEKLPAIFASRGCVVVATDGPNDVAYEWIDTGQHSLHKSQLFCDFIIDKDRFNSLVSFEVCDMKNISSHLRDFDLCWSACSLEHLGSLDAGIEFIANSLKTLKVGGIAIHTTEFNVSSETETAASGPTVLYRRSDIDRMRARLEKDGHSVRPITIPAAVLAIDKHVDFPPYSHNPHLKLKLMDYVTTSIGIVVKR